MRPSEARQAQGADAIYCIGPGLEEAIAHLAPGAETVELLGASGTTTLGYRTGATFALNDHGHEEHDRLALNPDLQFAVFHNAYQYFENRLALSAAGAIAVSDASDPSPARIEEVRNAVRDLDVTCGLAEPQSNQGLVRTVAEGRDMKSSVIAPTASEIVMDPDFYPQLIHSIAGKLAACGEWNGTGRIRNVQHTRTAHRVRAPVLPTS